MITIDIAAHDDSLFVNKRQIITKIFLTAISSATSDDLSLSVNNIVSLSRINCLNLAKFKAESFGYEGRIISENLIGEETEVANNIVCICEKIYYENETRKICLLFGRERSYEMSGKVIGGRNLNLALIVAGLLKDKPGITFLSGGTNGSDGLSNAAGAVVDSYTYLQASENLLGVRDFVENCDFYNFFYQVGGLIITEPVIKDVGDIMIALIN